MNRAVGMPRMGGFTIIEVLFFLAISGGLIAALLSTVGFAVSRQRFTDSIITTQAYVQSGYNETLNVVNDRSNTACSAGAGNTTVVGNGTTARGASSTPTCVILGRALAFTEGSSRVTSYAVIGREPEVTNGATGKALLLLYAPSIDEDSGQTFDVPWDAKVIGVRRAGGDNVTRLYLLRSPDSGLALTFGGSEDISGALGGGTGTYNLCVQSADLTNAVSLVSISGVAGSEGVTTKADINGDEQGTSC